jgi:hypothetical protein
LGDVQTVDSYLVSSNGKLEGAFNVTERLVLKTSNSPIAAKITLNNNNVVDDDKNPATAILESVNGKIEAEFFLKSSADDGKNSGGAYVVTGTTTNSPIAFVVSELPLNSTSTIVAYTSNGRAIAKLPPAFEGRFFARTTNGRVALDTPSSKVEDPSGGGRERHVRRLNLDRALRSVTGSVFWGEREEKDVPRGSVTVQTTNSNAELTI